MRSRQTGAKHRLEAPPFRCATRSAYDLRKCNDTVVAGEPADEAIIKPRTDSAAMAMLAKKQKERRQAERSDRGFIR